MLRKAESVSNFVVVVNKRGDTDLEDDVLDGTVLADGDRDVALRGTTPVVGDLFVEDRGTEPLDVAELEGDLDAVRVTGELAAVVRDGTSKRFSSRGVGDEDWVDLGDADLETNLFELI